MPETDIPEYAPLPAGMRARFVPEVNGLRMHILEGGHDEPGRPLVLLLHGFPELGYSWRKVMPALVSAGFHVVAPDQRGFGRTTGWDGNYDGDLRSFGVLNLVRDVLSLTFALGRRSVAGVVGHDAGSMVAAWCALIRPDVFRSAVLMSQPFAGAPSIPLGGAGPEGRQTPKMTAIDGGLSQLERPRKHYQWYYSTRQANADMMNCPQGVHAFLRAYFHHKSADWPGNRPFPLKSWTADELAKMPTYYIMDLERDMPQTVSAEMPSAAEIADCKWLTEDELRVYGETFRRTGFQGGLQWYRNKTLGHNEAEVALFAGRTLDVPSMYIAGKQDWGTFQLPGSFERMQRGACTQMVGCHLIEGAGHWVQQEQAEEVCRLLCGFLSRAS